MKTAKRIIGDRGEKLAAVFLKKNKYKILTRNYGARAGEIDIVARKKIRPSGQTLCFIEVKTRKFDDGSAERATDGQKLSRLFKAARRYCLEKEIDLENTPIQFEQVSVFTETGVCKHYIIPVD